MIYDHITNERETKAVEKLNGLFSSKSDKNDVRVIRYRLSKALPHTALLYGFKYHM